MSLLKKIISSVCALGMLSAVAVSAINVQAADLATIKAELTEYNNETGEGTVTVSFDGIETIISQYAADCAVVAGFANSVILDEADFDTSLYGRTPPANPAYKKNITKAGSWEGTFTPGPYTEGKFTISCTSMNQTTSTPLYQFNFKVNDVTKDNTITIYDAYADVNTWNPETFEFDKVVTYGDAVHGSTNTSDSISTSDTATEGTGGGDITITIPGSGGSNTSEGVAIDPEKIGAEGENGVFTTSDPDFEGDKAVAKLANVTANNEGVMVWNVTGTRAAGGEENVNMDFKIPNTQGEVSVGLIVGYNEADWSSVVINSVTTQAQ